MRCSVFASPLVGAVLRVRIPTLRLEPRPFGGAHLPNCILLCVFDCLTLPFLFRGRVSFLYPLRATRARRRFSLGGRSRGYYHGVPRVLAGTAPPSLRRAAAGDAELLAVCEWLEGHRINLNVRQCFEEEQQEEQEATAETEPGGGAELAEREPPSRVDS